MGKVLVLQAQGPEFTLQNPCKTVKLSGTHMCAIQALERQRQEELEACQPSRLAHLASSRFSGRPA